MAYIKHMYGMGNGQIRFPGPNFKYGMRMEDSLNTYIEDTNDPLIITKSCTFIALLFFYD